MILRWTAIPLVSLPTLRRKGAFTKAIIQVFGLETPWAVALHVGLPRIGWQDPNDVRYTVKIWLLLALMVLVSCL